MKIHTDDLFRLVNSLSLSEKRYCNIYLQKHSVSEENRYLKLFRILVGEKVYDAVSTSARVGYSRKPSHYSVLKKQLYEQLLDALHQFDLFSNPEQQLIRGIHQCSILIQHGLFAQAEKRIKKLFEKAIQMDHYEAQLQLQHLKMMLKARKYYRHETDKDLLDWKDKTDSILKNMEVTSRYRYLSSVIYKMQYDTGSRGKELAEKMKQIVSLPEFKNESNAQTLRAKLDFIQVRALYHFTNSETAKAANYNQRFLALLDQNPLLMQLHADRYFSVLNNYLIDCLLLKEFDKMKAGIEKLRGLQKQTSFRRLINFEANVFRLGYILELNYLIASGKFKEAFSKAEEISTGLEIFGDKVVKHNRITLRYLIAYAAFALGKFSEALDFIQPILNEKEMAVAEEVQLSSKMLQLLCHFEMRENLLLESLTKSTKRIHKQAKGHAIQHLVISFVRNASRQINVDEDRWMNLEKKVKALAKTTEGKAALNLFDYTLWIQAHISGNTLSETWQNR